MHVSLPANTSVKLQVSGHSFLGAAFSCELIDPTTSVQAATALASTLSSTSQTIECIVSCYFAVVVVGVMRFLFLLFRSVVMSMVMYVKLLLVFWLSSGRSL